MGKGKGEGPMGEPYKEEIKMTTTDEIIDLIENEIGGEEDGEPNRIKNIPSQEPKEMVKRVEDDIIGDVGFDEDEPDEDVTGVGISNEMVDTTLLDQDNAYQAYFRTVMKKHNIEGIRGLSPDKRSAFFKDVSAGWRSKKKSVREEGKEHRREQTDKRIARKVYLKGEKEPSATYYGDTKKDIRRMRTHDSDYGSQQRKMFGKKLGASDVARDKTGFIKSASPSKPDAMAKKDIKRLKKHRYSESEKFESYKQFCNYMMEQCGINDLTTLSEEELGNFFTLANEAFIMMNELVQKPGEGYEKGILQGKGLNPRQRRMMVNKDRRRYHETYPGEKDLVGASSGTVRHYNVRGTTQSGPQTSKVRGS